MYFVPSVFFLMFNFHTITRYIYGYVWPLVHFYPSLDRSYVLCKINKICTKGWHQKSCLVHKEHRVKKSRRSTYYWAGHSQSTALAPPCLARLVVHWAVQIRIHSRLLTPRIHVKKCSSSFTFFVCSILIRSLPVLPILSFVSVLYPPSLSYVWWIQPWGRFWTSRLLIVFRVPFKIR